MLESIGAASFPRIIVSRSFRIFFVPWIFPLLQVLLLLVIFLEYLAYSFKEIPSEHRAKKLPLFEELALFPAFLVDKKHPLID